MAQNKGESGQILALRWPFVLNRSGVDLDGEMDGPTDRTSC